MPVSFVPGICGKSSYVSMPYSDFAGPLFKEDLPAEFLYGVLKELGANSVEIRTEIPLNDIEAKQEYSTYRMDLPENEDELLRQLPSKSVRYSIRRARSDGFTVRKAVAKDIPLFHRLMNLTRRRHGLPTPPLKFYTSLYNNILDIGNGTLFIAETASGEPAAASLFLWFGEMGYYKYNASDPNIHVGNANHLLLWGGMKEGICRKCRTVDLGRVSRSNEGLIRFKEHWLGKRVPLHYVNVLSDGSIEPISGGESVFFKLTKRIFTKMPAGFSRVAGNILYRYFT